MKSPQPPLTIGTTTQLGLGQIRFVLLLLIVLGLSFTVRVAAAVVWQNRLPSADALAWGDSSTYWELAENWVERGSYQFGEPPQRIFRTPGYPAVLILGMQIAQFMGGELTVFHARLIGCVLGTAAVWLLIGWTVDLTGDRRIGLIAGGLMAVEPGALAMSVFVLAEAAFIPLMVLSLWAWTLAWRQTTYQRLVPIGLLAGIITGAAILVRPSWLLFAPCTVGLAFLVFPQRFKQIALALSIGVGIVLSMLPWWYRNYQLTDRWVPTTLQVGASLYDGWNPAADGGSDMTHGYQITRPLLQRYRAELEADLGKIPPEDLDRRAVDLELQSNDCLLRESWNWGRENPVQLLQLAGTKVWRTWRPWPAAAEVQSFWMTLITVLAFVPVIVLSIVGAWQWARRDYVWAMGVWPAIYVTILHAVFVGSIRYRQPAIIPLLVLVAVVVGSYLWTGRNHSKDSGR